MDILFVIIVALIVIIVVSTRKKNPEETTQEAVSKKRVNASRCRFAVFIKILSFLSLLGALIWAFEYTKKGMSDWIPWLISAGIFSFAFWFGFSIIIEAAHKYIHKDDAPDFNEKESTEQPSED